MAKGGAFFLDVVVLACCVALAFVVGTGIFSKVEGGGMPTNTWFGWHPVLMTIACPVLMPVGRLAYLAEPIWPGMKTIWGRRGWHGAVNTLAALALLAGYLCIFKAHWPGRKFFGYDFKQQVWEGWSNWTRVAHGWIGYMVIMLTVAQAVMGAAKIKFLKENHRVFTFHGQMGKAIVLLSTAVVALALNFWPWSHARKAVVGILVAVATVFGVFWPRDKADASGHNRPLVD